MKFDIYGRFQLEVKRENDMWVVYRIGEGKRSKSSEIFIPQDVPENELAVFLDDIFHEFSSQGGSIVVLS